MAIAKDLSRKGVVDRFAFDADAGTSQILWDTKLPGFGVRVYASGKKAFLLDYRVSGARKRLHFARYGAVTPEQARKRAMELLTGIDKGGDPLKTKKHAQQDLTVSAFAPIYLERAKEVGNPTGKKTRRPKRSVQEDARRLKTRILPAFGSRKLSSITEADAKRLHVKIGRKAPFEANRVLALIGVMFSAAEDLEHVPRGFANPAHGVPTFDEPSRDRYVKLEEMPALLAAIKAEPNDYIRALIMLALLLGCRRTELLAAKWEDVDFRQQTLRFPHTKANKIHLLPLSPQALGILEQLKNGEVLGNPHLFPSPVAPGEPMQNVKRAWKRIRETAGVTLWAAANRERATALHKQAKKAENALAEFHTLALAEIQASGAHPFDVHFHDLRRTLGSWLVQSGSSLPLIGRALNHADPSTTQIYARFALDPVRTALDGHANRLLALTSGT